MKSSTVHVLPYSLDAGELGEFDVLVHFTYNPGRPGKMYMSNGDPGYPDDPAEYEVIRVTYQTYDVTHWFDVGETLNESGVMADLISEWSIAQAEQDASDLYEALEAQRDYDLFPDR